jgi:thiamine pyrophosphate-dependent acetolactate synthase large subunit-like protein
VHVTDRAALAAACRAALASDRFTLIEAVVDKAEYAGQM